MRLRRWVILLSILSCSALLAQFDTGSITGNVFDPSGNAVPGAKIRLVNTETGVNIEILTNETGIYEFPTVRVGSYRITAEKAGFSTATVDRVVVSIGTRTRQDVRLTVGEVTQTIEVVGQTPLVESESSQRGQVIGGDTTKELP